MCLSMPEGWVGTGGNFRNTGGGKFTLVVGLMLECYMFKTQLSLIL